MAGIYLNWFEDTGYRFLICFTVVHLPISKVNISITIFTNKPSLSVVSQGVWSIALDSQWDSLSQTQNLIITSFCGHLPRYHYRMASIVSQIVVVLVNRELSVGSVNRPHVSRHNRQNIQ